MKRLRIRLSISRSLILLNTVLIVMTGLTVMFFSFTATKSSIHSVADNLLGEISKSVLTKTQTYLLPAERAVRSVSWLLWNHRLDADMGLETLLDYYQELLQNNAEFKAVYSGDTSGNLVMTRRMPDGSLSRRYPRQPTVCTLRGSTAASSITASSATRSSLSIPPTIHVNASGTRTQ
jgi:hypothetical protein